MRAYVQFRLERIVEYQQIHPEFPLKRVSIDLGIPLPTVYKTLKQMPDRRCQNRSTVDRRKTQFIFLKNFVA